MWYFIENILSHHIVKTLQSIHQLAKQLYTFRVNTIDGCVGDGFSMHTKLFKMLNACDMTHEPIVSIDRNVHPKLTIDTKFM